jgi:hypothetical protein
MQSSSARIKRVTGSQACRRSEPSRPVDQTSAFHEPVLARSRYPHFFLPIFFGFAGLVRLLARAFARAAARFFRHLSHLQPRRVMTLIK